MAQLLLSPLAITEMTMTYTGVQMLNKQHLDSTFSLTLEIDFSSYCTDTDF